MEGLREVDEETWKHMTTPSALGADAMDDEKLAAFANALADCTELDKFNDAALLRHLARRLLSLREENARYRTALEKIAKPTYGTELCNSQEENNEILARHFFRHQDIARAALTPTQTQRSEG